MAAQSSLESLAELEALLEEQVACVLLLAPIVFVVSATATLVTCHVLPQHKQLIARGLIPDDTCIAAEATRVEYQ
eukprot:SAG25_NODE_90_length_16264_cov_230.399876_1_plen_75_part_00